MIVGCSITLDGGDHLGMSLDDAAKAILEAVGGDPTKDVCSVTLMMPPGSAGSTEPPSPPV